MVTYSLTCHNNTWKNYSDNDTFNTKINKQFIEHALFKIKIKFVDKIYNILQSNNYHFFLPFIDLGMIMYIYDNINQYSTKSVYLPHYSTEVVIILIDAANEVLSDLVSTDKDLFSIALILKEELKSYISINYDMNYIKEIKYMLEYINNLSVHSDFTTFHIMNISNPLILNNNTINILNQFLLCWKSGELEYIHKYKDMIINMYYLPSNIKISINICKSLMKCLNINNNSIYYINKNMPKTIYYEAKISERIKKNKKQNHNIHLYYLKYQKPLNNIYYLKDYTQLFTTKIQQTNKIYTNNFIDTLLLQSQLIKDEFMRTTTNVLPYDENKLIECHKLLQQIQQTSPDNITSIFITLLSNLAN